MDKNMINRFVLPEDLKQALDSAEKIIFPKTKAQLVELCYGCNGAARFNVSYDISEKESYVEADVVRCKNWLVGKLYRCLYEKARSGLYVYRR